MEDCVFCKIIGGEVPAVKIFENAEFLVFLDAFPAVAGHALIIPKGHYENFMEVPKELLGKYAELIQSVELAVKKVMDVEAINLTSVAGKLAGQSVFHVHFHAVPMSENDGMQFQAKRSWWVPRNKEEVYAETSAEEVAEKIRKEIENN